ncbi:hypothetical protein MKX34_02630 [Paenibacillus sp. FSL R5-0636]|uniref:hypothetical protein n=2 Tax=Paenibacillus TaxID=44249 RepID=UPI00096D337B|nr:hypothetical protein [Paenibacillus odorifer]OMC98479.1 hypothetical protein BJP49_08590 [Paenibacillus odorifer]
MRGGWSGFEGGVLVRMLVQFQMRGADSAADWFRFQVWDTVSAASAVSGVGYGRLPDGIATLGKNSLKSAK